MDGQEIGLVLARALELRSKINNCINSSGSGGGGQGREVDLVACRTGEQDDEEEEEEAESLLGVRDALDSLERQLSALQALQHQQRYERESILAQIDRSRMTLLRELEEYRGEDLEVIHEAAAFAGEKIEHDDGLVLPPYPSHLPDLFVLDDIYPSSHITAKYKVTQNGSIANSKLESKGSEKEKSQNTSKGIGHIVGFAAKSVITFVSVISILCFAGYQPNLKKWSQPLNAIQLFNKQQDGEGRDTIQCPPGKVVVIEGGKTRCLVKERIEVPFESDVATPDVRYGFG